MKSMPRTPLRLSILGCLTMASILAESAHAQCVGLASTCFGEGALSSNTAAFNSAFGEKALEQNTHGQSNSAFGARALWMNTLGNHNTAVGHLALSRNTTGEANTAIGMSALVLNTTGFANTALGYQALKENVTAIGNTAIGAQAMQENVTGEQNTAIGRAALFSNAGNENTAVGGNALISNSTGDFNTGSGSGALFSNTTGNTNTANGANSLYSNTTGIRNTAVGFGSLRNNSTGVRNVALGYQAGFAVTGSDNIVIGSSNLGKAVENGVVRIGNDVHQKKTFIAGIRGAKTGSSDATAVFIDSNGQLGTIKSSREFKEDIHPMGDTSERLLALRPVTFRYKEADENGVRPIQFGLIAEEVAEVFPELVVHDVRGVPETVRYDHMATLLLNEFQKAKAEMSQLRSELAAMAGAIERLQQSRLAASAN